MNLLATARSTHEFSSLTRQAAIGKMGRTEFDLLIVGGGITGVAAARDAASRGLRVALVEQSDFAAGTSSASSKLIHGGLRYLEQGELRLVFEALEERALLLKTAPHLVRPLPFYFPVYRNERPGLVRLGIGLALYDTLATFRSPGIHKRYSASAMAREIPGLSPEGLSGGYRYFDASVWDDALVVEIARAASMAGSAVVNYVEAVDPLWQDGVLKGFVCRDQAPGASMEPILVRAHRVIFCLGPWTDRFLSRIGPGSPPYLSPSKGVHFVVPLSRLPLPGAVVMNHPADGRIVFAMPRPDFGSGVLLVGTTDGPTAPDPADVRIERADIDYLLRLLERYFPQAQIRSSDIISAYAGVRPLIAADRDALLQQVSREHHIGEGPGRSVVVAGGKYTTHRRMAKEAVDRSLHLWNMDAAEGTAPPLPAISSSDTSGPVNLSVMADEVEEAQRQAHAAGLAVPETLWARYGAEALQIGLLDRECERTRDDTLPDPEGFPCLVGQFRHELRRGMVVRLEDFYFRRLPLFLSRADHGVPWIDELSEVQARDHNLSSEQAAVEREALLEAIGHREVWRKSG